jgi:GNAT superfamily N-acetyltransferase
MIEAITNYQIELTEGLIVQQTKAEHVEQLEELQKTVFPTLADDELIKAVHYLKHIELFPEGQLVITDQNKVIGMTTTMRTFFNFNNHHHTFKEIIAGGWLSNHNPEGDWLYGLDMGILPAYRGRGLARVLYRARHDIARNLGLKGQLAVGMMSGYGVLSKEMSGETYFNQLINGQRKDPTLSPQMKIGFEPVALIHEHLNDPVCGNFGVLIKLDIAKEV